MLIMGETKKVNFIGACPKGHGPTFSHDPEELGRELDGDSLRLFCAKCGDFHVPGAQEKTNLRKRLEEVESS